MSVLISASALGIPGEKESELEKRYGKPVKVEVTSYWEDAKNLVYRWNGYEIEVFLCKGKKDWWKGTSQRETVRNEKGEPFSVEEINTWLERNGAGQKWIEDFEHLKPDPGVTMVNKPEKVWRRADNKVIALSGVVADDGEAPSMGFFSQELYDL